MGEAKIKAMENLAMQTLIGAKSCRSCDYRTKMHGKIFCRRFPPQNVGGLVPGPDGRPVTLFLSSYPECNPDLPCGEYKRNEAHAADELREATPPALKQ